VVADALNGQAHALVTLGELTRATEVYQQIIDNYPDQESLPFAAAMGLQYIGNLFLQLNRIEDALAAWKRPINGRAGGDHVNRQVAAKLKGIIERHSEAPAPSSSTDQATCLLEQIRQQHPGLTDGP